MIHPRPSPGSTATQAPGARARASAAQVLGILVTRRALVPRVARMAVAALAVLGLTSTSLPARAQEGSTGVLNAGFICTQGVFNTELTAPYDVLQHTVYRDEENYVRCFIVTQDGEPFVSAEGITIAADYSFDNAPPIDILIVPSSEHSMDEDLANEAFIGWLKQRIESASWVMTLCDGAFPLGATGKLNGLVATTFPGDRDRFAEMFPEIDVRYDVRFVVDGKFITSVGGAPSFEPAFYLVEHLYGKAHADRSAVGLVFPWDLEEVPHLVVTP